MEHNAFLCLKKTRTFNIRFIWTASIFSFTEDRVMTFAYVIHTDAQREQYVRVHYLLCLLCQ